MINWYLEVNRLFREIRNKTFNASSALKNGDESEAKVVNGYLNTEYKNVRRVWVEHLDPKELGSLGRHIRFGKTQDYDDILNHDLPAAEEKAEQHLLENQHQQKEIGFEKLLHPVVFENAYHHYRSGHHRDAVLNAYTAVFDLIKKRTGLDSDGARLASQVFSPQNPKLILSELGSESGRNDQAGFLQLFQGAYTGIRNPKAHSLRHDLTDEKAAQYLIFASILARRVEEANEP